MRWRAILLGWMELVASAVPAFAQTGFQPSALTETREHLFCFETGSEIPTAEAFSAAAQIGADMREYDQRQAFHSDVLIEIPVGSPDDPIKGARLSQLEYELAMAGVSFGRQSRKTGSERTDDCLVLTARFFDGPVPPALWHYWGPYFAEGNATLTEMAMRGLRTATLGYQSGQTCFLVEGHTDTAGSVEANQRLSLRRAEAVRSGLMRMGVRYQDVIVRGRGETQLARPTSDGVAERLNRRVRVDVRPGACDALVIPD